MTSRPDDGSFDAGWLFVTAGLVICAAGLLIPAQRDLAGLQRQLAELRLQESVANDRLNAHTEFLDDLDREDSALVRRLAGAHLNLMPDGDTPALLASSVNAPVTEWIDATVRVPALATPQEQPSRLSRWATGPRRLWMLASGVMCVFVGLVLDPAIGRSPRRERAGPLEESSRSTSAALPVADLSLATMAPVHGDSLGACDIGGPVESQTAALWPAEKFAGTDWHDEAQEELATPTAANCPLGDDESAIDAIDPPQPEPSLDPSEPELVLEPDEDFATPMECECSEPSPFEAGEDGAEWLTTEPPADLPAKVDSCASDPEATPGDEAMHVEVKSDAVLAEDDALAEAALHHPGGDA